jgi:hypothetical protein
MIVVTDVEAASRWLRDVVGVSSGRGGHEYELSMNAWLQSAGSP